MTAQREFMDHNAYLKGNSSASSLRMSEPRQKSASAGEPPKVTMARRPPLSGEELPGRVRGVVKRTRATVTLDDDLVRIAQAFTGIEDKICVA